MEFDDEEETRTTKRVAASATRHREFTLAGKKERSLSVSKIAGTIDEIQVKKKGTRTRYEYPEDTFLPDAVASDSERMHKHPGGNWHTPGDGVFAGSTTTPVQRAALDALDSTDVATHVVRAKPNKQKFIG